MVTIDFFSAGSLWSLEFCRTKNEQFWANLEVIFKNCHHFTHKSVQKCNFGFYSITGNYTNEIRLKVCQKSNISEKKNMVANFGFKITFLNSFLCEKIDSFQKFLKHALCHKSDFNPCRMVNAILLLDISYVILISSYWLVPEFFIEHFLRNDSPWWLKNHQNRPNSHTPI